MESVPFSIKKVYRGLAECRGMIWLESQQLVIELETRDGIFGVLRSGVKTIAIQYSELESVSFRKGFFRGGKLCICARRMSTLANIPGQREAEVELRIKRRHRSKAMVLAATANLNTAELSLERMRTDDGREAVAGPTPAMPEAPEPPVRPGPEPTARDQELES
jgi:hypothetical protein